MANEQRDEGRQGGSEGRTLATRAEWVTAVIGAALTLATIGYLAYEGLAQPPEPVPDVQVVAQSIVPQGNGWLVRVEARNHGRATAAHLHIVGELRDDTTVVETSQTVFDYVPERSSRRGGLMFSRNPALHALEVRATGYERP